jgi:micrococcal nuclease
MQPMPTFSGGNRRSVPVARGRADPAWAARRLLRPRWLLALAGVGTLAVLALWRAVPRVPELGTCEGAGVPQPSGALPQAVPAGVPEGAQAAVVVRVVDGDGVCVRPAGPGTLADDRVHEVRLIGINAPGKDACGSTQAAAYLRRAVGGAPVWLSADDQDRDRYRRFLRYVWDGGGRLVNVAAVREGYARALSKPPNDRHTPEIETAEAEARRAGRGVWRCLPWSLLRWLPR